MSMMNETLRGGRDDERYGAAPGEPMFGFVPAWAGQPAPRRAPFAAHDVWTHLCVGLAAVLIAWAALFVPVPGRAAQLGRFAVMLRLTGGELSSDALARYERSLDPAIVTLARRFAARSALAHPQSALTPGLAEQAAADAAAVHPEAVFRYQDLTPDQARIWNSLVPVAKAANPPAQPFVLPTTDLANYQKAVNCLSAAVYYEAASESQAGQQAVAQVVLNRMRHPTYPKTVCGVVFEGSQLATGCQFSFACDGSLARRPSLEGWARARKVAVAALGGFVAGEVGQATHYHAVYVAPYWSPSLLKVRNIGAHIFYRWMGGSGLPGAFRGAYGGSEPTIAKLAALDAAFTGPVPEAPAAALLAEAPLHIAQAPVEVIAPPPAQAAIAAPAAVHTEIAAAGLPLAPAAAPVRAAPRQRRLATPQGW